MNKKIFTLMITTILFLSCISAFDFDNKKNFEKGNLKYGKIEIKNSFGFGKTLEVLTLTNNTDICLEDCFALIEIDLMEDGVLIEDVSFTDIIKKYDFFIIEDNKKKKYKLGQEVKAGKYIIRLDGKKAGIKTIDWIIKTKGKWLNEWAIWGANITLNSPANNSIFTQDNVSFNCSAVSNISIINMSLYDNSTGSWLLNKTQESIISFCYQESTNISNQTGIDGDCGLNYTGEYYVVGDTASIVYVNYTKPENVIGSKWFSKHGDLSAYNSTIPNSCLTYNEEKLILRFRSLRDTQVDGYNWSSYGQCFNGSWNTVTNIELGRETGGTSGSNKCGDIGFQNLFDGNFSTYCLYYGTFFNTSSFNIRFGRIYEEAIYWEIDEWNNNHTEIIENNYSDGYYKWNCQACDNESCAFSNENRTFLIDTSAPTINITSPTGFINYGKVGLNFSLNWNTSNGNLDSCWFDYNNTNTSVNCLDNQTTFIITDQKNLTFYANDTGGNLGSNFTSWDYRIFEINQTFSNETIEGTLETFEANIEIVPGLSIIAVSLVYNGTNNIGSSSLIGNTTKLITSNVLIPSIQTDTNFSFYWSIVLSDSSQINLSTKNQTALKINLDNCSVFTNKIFIFTSLDEEEQTILSNTTKEIAINFYPIDRSIVSFNLSGEFNSNPTEICLNNNLTQNANFSIDVIVRYEAEDYVNEYYNIVNFILDNNTEVQNISLYNLLLIDSTDFQLTFTGVDFLPVEDALVFIERQYISENTFKTVELPKTDSNGQTILHLVGNDVIYNIIVMKEGEIIGTFRNLIAFCDDFSIGNCKITLNALSEDLVLFNYDSGVGILYDSPPTYDSLTNIVSFTFTSTDGTSKILFMDVERRDVFGNTSVCNNTLVSSGGTLFCNIGNITESTLYATVSVNNVNWISSILILDKTAYGSFGYVFLFVFSLGIVLVFGDSKNGILFSLLIGYMGAVSMGVLIGGIVGFGSAGIWILILTVMGIWQVNKERVN